MTVSRRQFVAGTAGLGLLAGCGRLPWQAQPAAPKATRLYRIGLLGVGPDLPAPLGEALRELGYVEGRDFSVEARDLGSSSDQRRAQAQELVDREVDILVVNGRSGAQVAREATKTIPIVSAGLSPGDLVERGLVSGLAYPGGNLTGLTNFERGLHGKRLELLSEATRNAARVAALWDANLDIPLPREFLEGPAQALGVQLQFLEVRQPEDLERAFEAAARERADALYLLTTALPGVSPHRLADLARQRALPTMFTARTWVDDGGLMAYEPRVADNWRRVAYYVDRILKGAKPADLPVEQPMTFDFVVNMKTAQALDITFPNEIMLQVTEIIQ
jgi:putative ABC transport system substrate-binding protein